MTQVHEGRATISDLINELELIRVEAGDLNVVPLLTVGDGDQCLLCDMHLFSVPEEAGRLFMAYEVPKQGVSALLRMVADGLLNANGAPQAKVKLHEVKLK